MRAFRALVALLVGIRPVTAARALDSNDVGVDLLVRTAEDCDLIGAFRLMRSSSFRAEWLGPPCQAQRDGKSTTWALEVMEAIRICKVAREELEWSKGKALNWYLPEKGEWLPPMSLEEMGIDLPVDAAIHEDVLALAQRGGVLAMPDGVRGRADVVVLWYAMSAYLREAIGSERRSQLERHIRSLGWNNFFASHSALPRYTHIIDLVASGRTGGAEAQGGQQVGGSMGMRLAMIWNRTGDFVVTL